MGWRPAPHPSASKRLGLEPDQFDGINNRSVITGSFKWRPSSAATPSKADTRYEN